MTQWRDDRIGSALRGENPTVMRRLPGGFAVIGDVQWLPGYCLLLIDDPAITRLSELHRPRRLQLHGDRRRTVRYDPGGRWNGEDARPRGSQLASRRQLAAAIVGYAGQSSG